MERCLHFPIINLWTCEYRCKRKLTFGMLISRKLREAAWNLTSTSWSPISGRGACSCHFKQSKPSVPSTVQALVVFGVDMTAKWIRFWWLPNRRSLWSSLFVLCRELKGVNGYRNGFIVFQGGYRKSDFKTLILSCLHIHFKWVLFDGAKHWSVRHSVDRDSVMVGNIVYDNELIQLELQSLKLFRLLAFSRLLA